MLQGIGSNVTAFVGDDGIVLIDCSVKQLAPKMEAALKTLSDKPIKFALNTHFHGDHTGGNAYFGKTVTLIGQDNMRKKMQSERDPRITDLPVSLPVITFSDQLTLHMTGGEIQATHFAQGHTDGDVIVVFPQVNVVEIGDNLTNFAPPHFPAIDADNDGSGGPKGSIAANEYVLSHFPDDVKIIPGHGNLATKTDATKYVAVLKETSAIVQAGIDQGKSLTQMKQEKVLAKWSYLDTPAITTDLYLERLYNGLTNGREAHKRVRPE